MPASAFSSTTTWTGSFDNEWALAANWSNNVPGVLSNDADIPNIAPSPNLSTLTESVPGLLTVEAGATVVIGTGSLTVGTLSTAVSGTSAFSISSGTLHVTGTSSLGSTISAIGLGIIQLDLAVTLAQTLTLGSTGGSITLGATVDGAAANTQDFRVEAGGGTISRGGAVGGGRR